MKLLFDANLSPELVRRLADLYFDSEHVAVIGLESSDTAIWEYAKSKAFTIVSKDSDFQQRAMVFGSPPKVILVRLGNCRTRLVESLLRQRSAQVAQFFDDPAESLLVLP